MKAYPSGQDCRAIVFLQRPFPQQALGEIKIHQAPCGYESIPLGKQKEEIRVHEFKNKQKERGEKSESLVLGQRICSRMGSSTGALEASSGVNPFCSSNSSDQRTTEIEEDKDQRRKERLELPCLLLLRLVAGYLGKMKRSWRTTEKKLKIRGGKRDWSFLFFSLQVFLARGREGSRDGKLSDGRT